MKEFLRERGDFLRRPPLLWTLLGCAVLLAYRRFDQIQLPQFWAEDGAVFFSQARSLGAAALLESSAGYYHTVLRVVAWLAAQADVSLAPAIYVAAAFSLTLYVAASTQSPRFPLPPSCAYAFAVVLIPDGFEVYLNLTNLQWILGCGLLVILVLREPDSARQKWHDFLGTLVLGLTGPFVVVLLPLFVWRALQRRTRFSMALAGLAAACAVVQVTAILLSHVPASATKNGFALFLSVAGARIGGALFTGGRLGASAPWLASASMGALMVAGVAFLVLRRGVARPERIWMGCAFAGIAWAVFYRCEYALPHLLNPGLGGRYFFPLQLIVVWLLIAAVMADRVWLRGAVAVFLLCAVLANFDRIREPALTDFDWPHYAARIREGEEVVVPINPVDWEFMVEGKHRPTAPGGAAKVGASRLVNVSSRCFVTAEQPASVGFVIRGGRPRKLLVRAVGPSLAAFHVRQPLEQPVLALLRDGCPVAQFSAGDNPRDDPEIKDATDRSGAFALRSGAGDRVGLVELSEGSYTVMVTTGDCPGEVLIEVYEIPDCWYPSRGAHRSRRR